MKYMYELAAFPNSMFTDSGDIRIAKSKSVLKNDINVSVLARLYTTPEAIVIDRSAIFWIVQWL
jgi:hypothetical protein